MKEWIGSIILFSIFAGIFEAVLPQDRIKKYVRLILGIFLIVIVLEPWIGAVSYTHLDVYKRQIQWRRLYPGYAVQCLRICEDRGQRGS